MLFYSNNLKKYYLEMKVDSKTFKISMVYLTCTWYKSRFLILTLLKRL